ncbi:hypothetical protein [Streptomyces himalayensis]|uniref:Uncharacterized protein n=1 Tax=Streptomyces himalayensis subsp. himalayensis TaxID=2756131 RepID=A0A7W0IBJ6_9ACTN|nr:hypothetical protein [Streptomyces himalayensis]MBA2949488.1 hypothetical protein [Streptomyces himalayensis subsp. himalayensis]
MSEDTGESDEPERPDEPKRPERPDDEGSADGADGAAPSRDSDGSDDAEPAPESWFRRGREQQDGSGLLGAVPAQPDRGHEDDLGFDHAHDPNEVTVQLDAVGYEEGRLTVQEKKKQGGHEVPVFVDDSGRRSRTLRRIGMAVGMVCAVYAMIIVATLLSGNSSAPWLPITGQNDDDKPAGKVETSPRPADPASPSASVGTTPGVSPSGTDGITASPGAGASPDPSASASEPGESADPDPTTSSKPDPEDSSSADPGPDPDPDPTGEEPSTPVDPEPTDTGEPSPEPTPSTGEGGDGTDTVAESPIAEVPVEMDPGSPSEPTAPSSPSSESTL